MKENDVISAAIKEVARIQLENIMQANQEIDIAAVDMNERFGFSKVTFKKLATLLFKNTKKIEQDKAEAVFDLYEELKL